MTSERWISAGLALVTAVAAYYGVEVRGQRDAAASDAVALARLVMDAEKASHERCLSLLDREGRRTLRSRGVEAPDEAAREIEERVAARMAPPRVAREVAAAPEAPKLDYPAQSQIPAAVLERARGLKE